MKKSQTQTQQPTLNRRTVLGGIAAVPFITGMAPKPTWSMTDADVIVIGAGMSGLAAALTLEEEGRKVIVLEGSDHVGGRAYTLRTNEGNFDCGATTIGPLYGRVRYFAEQAGAELISPTARDPFSYHVNGQFVHPDQWESSAANLLADNERMFRPESLEFVLTQQFNKIDDLSEWSGSEMLQYDIPLDAYFKANGVSDEALKFIGLTANAMSLSRVSALFQMREVSRLTLLQSGDAPLEGYSPGENNDYQYVKGGMSSLPEKMALLLKDEARLNTAVDAINIEDDGVSVVTRDGKTLTARYIICTAPLTSLANIRISPKLTGAKLKAVSDPHYSLTTHVFCIPTEPYWEMDGAPAGLYTDNMIERVFAEKDESGKVSWLDVWINGTGAGKLENLTEAELFKVVEDQLALVRPSTKGRVKAVASYSWGKNEFVGGNKQIYQPGQASSFYSAMTAPWNERLRFAGEHTRDYEAGLEAAAATGMREAMDILTKL